MCAVVNGRSPSDILFLVFGGEGSGEVAERWSDIGLAKLRTDEAITVVADAARLTKMSYRLPREA